MALVDPILVSLLASSRHAKNQNHKRENQQNNLGNTCTVDY